MNKWYYGSCMIIPSLISPPSLYLFPHVAGLPQMSTEHWFECLVVGGSVL